MASSSHLKPGEKGTITVKVNTTGRKGPVLENVEVVTNDSQRTKITLTIQAYVMEPAIQLFSQ
jgi:hypothetical protein